MEIFLFSVLLLLSLAGLLLAAFQLPGAWLILLAAAGYDWYFGWQRFGWEWLLPLVLVAAAAEVFEFMAGALVARHGGASRRASIAALVGGVLGMFFLAIPLPVVGVIVGGLIGCFAGALLAELSLNKDVLTGTRVGLFAVVGRLIGTIGKTAAAVVIAGVVVSRALYAMW